VNRTNADTTSAFEPTSSKPSSQPSGCVTTRVLIVDDEPAILSSTAALLRNMDFDVATCADARMIREAIERVVPDVLLQDVRMPGLDLERLVFSLRDDDRWRDLPIVLFTAGMDAQEIARRIDVAAVLEKPFAPHDLAAVLGRALDARATA
jgi:CheY-like chemotaxis protein